MHSGTNAARNELQLGGAFETAAASFRDYVELTKPRITWLILVSTAVGYFFGLSADDWHGLLRQACSWVLFHTLFGTALMASGTAALNEWLERGSDARMHRTSSRPIPSGRVKADAAFAFGVAISALGLVELIFGAGAWPASIGLLTLLLYLFVYTPLKTRSWLCTTVGALPGALPPAIGFAAAHGALNAKGVALAAILFVWQFPHFYSIAWMYREDYGRAGIKMLPVVEPNCTSTARQIIVYAALLLPISLLPVALGMSGIWYASAAGLLGLWILYSGLLLMRERTARRARNVLLASVSYLPLLYACMLLDRSW
jgi:protoheme IX farnesyltransferase